MPEVSVIIPTYNSAQYITAAVDSVFAQTYSDYEVLVIDDGSTDETKEILGRYGSRIRYVHQPNGGVATARNRGISEGGGRYVAFLDSDDVWYPHKLQRQISELEKLDRQGLICYSAYMATDSNLCPLTVQKSQHHESLLHDLLTLGNVVGPPSTVLGERSLFLSLGGFDTALSQCADWDMWIRLSSQSDFVYLDEPLVWYRRHAKSMSSNAPLLESDSVRVLEKGFEMAGLPSVLRGCRQSARGRNYMVLAGTYYHARQFRDCLRCLAHATALDYRQLGRLLTFPLRTTARWRSSSIG